jgi:hypothetical protein
MITPETTKSQKSKIVNKAAKTDGSRQLTVDRKKDNNNEKGHWGADQQKKVMITTTVRSTANITDT